MTVLQKQQMLTPTSFQFLHKVVIAQFPQRRSFSYQFSSSKLDDILPDSEKNLMKVCNRLGKNNAPGLDGISNIA